MFCFWLHVWVAVWGEFLTSQAIDSTNVIWVDPSLWATRQRLDDTRPDGERPDDGDPEPNLRDAES